jgi:hypothetical protein
VWVSRLVEHNRDNYGAFGQNTIVQKFKMAALLRKYTTFYILPFLMFWKLQVTKYQLMAYYVASILILLKQNIKSERNMPNKSKLT